MKKLSLLLIATLFICAAEGQVRTLYVTGTVSSDEKMLVSVRGTKTIEGVVVIAELNGKKTEAKTDNNGQAILDFSSIAAGLANPAQAVIRSFDKDGNLLSTANTTVQAAGSRVLAPPVIEQLPNNLPSGEAVTIPGRNLGADSKVMIGNQAQKVLTASDLEITTMTNANTGQQPVYVTTANGVSERQFVNVYSLDFTLPKNSILPKENVQAMVRYESIPAGTKLIFTNKSQETIKMTIPGAENAANECIYTVAEKNGSLPVNITGITKGDFKIALDFNFKEEPVKPINEKTEDGNKPPVVFYDEKPQAPLKTLADTLKIKEDVIKGVDEISKLIDGESVKDDEAKTVKTAGALAALDAAIAKEQGIIAAEKSILSDRRFSNVVSGDPMYNPDYDKTHQNPGNMQKARDNIEKALVQEGLALQNKLKAAIELDKLNKLIPKLKSRISRAKADEISADKLKNGTKAEQEKAKGLKSDAETNEKEALKELDAALKSLNDILILVTAADDATNKAIEFKNDALINIGEYIKNSKSEKDRTKAQEYRDALKSSRDKLVDDEKALKDLLNEVSKINKLVADAKDDLDKIIKK